MGSRVMVTVTTCEGVDWTESGFKVKDLTGLAWTECL